MPEISVTLPKGAIAKLRTSSAPVRVQLSIAALRGRQHKVEVSADAYAKIKSAMSAKTPHGVRVYIDPTQNRVQGAGWFSDAAKSVGRAVGSAAKKAGQTLWDKRGEVATRALAKDWNGLSTTAIDAGRNAVGLGLSLPKRRGAGKKVGKKRLTLRVPAL